MTYIHLQGWIPNTTSDQRPISQDSLNNSNLTVTVYGTQDDGEKLERYTWLIVRLRTSQTAHGEMHLAIRDGGGKHLDYLTSGMNDILIDGVFPSPFVGKNGTYTFEVTARLGDEHDGQDGTCLFSISMTQWLEGEPFQW